MFVVWFCIPLLGVLLGRGVLGYLEELNRNKATYLTARVGGHVVFNCPIDFPHDIAIPYSLRWNKENHTVFAWSDETLTAADPSYKGRVTLAPDVGVRGAVNLTAIRESDSGWFECSVFFPNRKPNTRPNGTWFHLAVEGGTLLAEPPINVTLLEGETANFPCVTRDASAKVTWFKDGVALNELALRDRATVSVDGSLNVGPVRMGDSGELLCVVTSAHGERQTAGAFLDVQFAAKVVFSPREVLFPSGGSAMLDCHFRSNPALTNLRWEKDGLLFDPYNVPGVFYKRNGSLYFTNVNESHAGLYTCTPYNKLGTSGTSPVIRVVVQKPPVFTVLPHSLYLRRLGDTLQMSCDAIDDASIVWLRKDGASLPMNRTRMRNGNLTIEHVQASDSGVYQCVASNMAASVTSDAELMIESLSPRPAHNLTATVTSTSFTASWTPGSMRLFAHHTLWWRFHDSDDWRAMAVPEGTSSATARYLLPGRVYHLFVTSTEGEGGEGVVSQTITVTTPGPDERLNSALNSVMSLSPPRNLAAELTDSGALLHWDPPAHGAQALVSYRVHWDHDDVIVDTTNTWLMVPSPREDGTFTVSVSAVSSDSEEATAELQLVVPSSGVHAVSVALGAAGICLLVALVGGIYWKSRTVRT